MPQGVTLSELARRLGRAKSGLHKLAASKQIPRLADGTFDQSAVAAALVRNLDPACRKDVNARPVNGEQVNGERAPSGPFDCALAFADPVHCGAAWLDLQMLYRLPAIAANLSLPAGASVATAFTLRRLVAVAAMVELEDALGAMGADSSTLQYRPGAFDDLDWRLAAKNAGEPYAPKQWAAHLAQINTRLEAA